MTVQLGRPDTAPMARAKLYAACRRGDLPAELLDTADREHLIRWFWHLRWTDTEIATRTYMTTYTVARIRSRIGLTAHPSTKGAVA